MDHHSIGFEIRWPGWLTPRVDLDQALDEFAAERTGSDPAVALTFDDGTADFAEHVVGVLDEFELPATVYVATEPVLTGERWPDGAAPLSPEALAEVAGHRLVTIGCHTHAHLLLDREPPSGWRPTWIGRSRC